MFRKQGLSEKVNLTRYVQSEKKETYGTLENDSQYTMIYTPGQKSIILINKKDRSWG